MRSAGRTQETSKKPDPFRPRGVTTHIVSIRARSIVGRLDLVEVVLVELADKASKVRVLEVLRQDRRRELVHVLCVIMEISAGA